MRIGLVLFGHLRSYRKTLDSYGQFLKTLQQAGDVDLFCHTWDIEESMTNDWWKQYEKMLPPAANVSSADMIEKYKPVGLLIEPSKKFDDNDYNLVTSTPVSGVLSMLYSQQKAFNLLCDHEASNNFRYDIIVKSRYDLLYEIAPAFSGIIQKSKKPNSLFFPSSNTYELSGSWSDVFAIGNRDLMECCLTIYKDFSFSVDRYIKHGFTFFVPELCYSKYFEDKHINIKEVEGLRIAILRTSGASFNVNSDINFKLNSPLCFYRKIILQNERLSPDIQTVKRYRMNLINKYMSWVIPESKSRMIQLLGQFYYGEITAFGPLITLLRANADKNIFSPVFIRSFVEESFCNRKHAPFKELILAFILTFFRGYRTFFWKVWIKKYLKNFKKKNDLDSE